MIKDLTQGKPTKVLLGFCIPLLISAVFQQLYNMADSIIAGKVLGESALAAVGASYPITMIFMAIALGCNLGCSVVISKLFGEKKILQVKSGVSTIMPTGTSRTVFPSSRSSFVHASISCLAFVISCAMVTSGSIILTFP